MGFLLVWSQLRRDVDIAFDFMLFTPTACLLMLSWTFKELYFDYTSNMSTFAIKNSFLCMHKVCFSLFFQYSLPFAVYNIIVRFGLAWLPAVCEKCVFPLADTCKQNKRKTFFSHTAGSLRQVCVGLRSHGLCKVQFLFCHLPLPDMPHPLNAVFLECNKLKRNYSLATFLCLCKTFAMLNINYVNKSQAAWVGLAWLLATCEKDIYNLFYLYFCAWCTLKKTSQFEIVFKFYVVCFTQLRVKLSFKL